MQNSRLKGQIAARMKQKCTMKPNTILSRKGTIISGKMDEAGSPEYTKQKGLDKKKLLTMLQQVVENAGEAGIKLNDIYEYMEVTLPVGKSMAEKKRQLRYLLNLLKDDGIVSREGMRWIFVMDTQ